MASCWLLSLWKSLSLYTEIIHRGYTWYFFSVHLSQPWGLDIDLNQSWLLLSWLFVAALLAEGSRNAAHFVQSMGPTWTLWQMECTQCYRIQITVSAGEGSKKRTLETAGEPQLMPGASPSEVAKCFLSWNFLVGTCWYKFLHSGAWSWRGSSDIAPIAKNMQSQAGTRAEAQAAGGVTPLQRCWMHPKPQELGSEKTKLNWDGKEIQTSPGCVHSGYSFFHSALQSRSNDAVIIQAWLCL